MPDESLFCVLNSAAWKILGGLLRTPQLTSKRETAHVWQKGMAVTITVAPLGQVESEPIPGRWLSDAEELVWRALRPGEWLVGKEIAARCNRDYDRDPKFKHLLMNLEDRGVLLHEDGKGYARAIVPTGEDNLHSGSA